MERKGSKKNGKKHERKIGTKEIIHRLERSWSEECSPLCIHWDICIEEGGNRLAYLLAVFPYVNYLDEHLPIYNWT